MFDNLSLGPVSRQLTSKFNEERVRLDGLDRNVDLKTRISTIEDVIQTIEGKLTGSDKWFFTLGMAVRRVTAPFQSDRALDRAKLRTALAELNSFVNSAPPEVDRTIVANLKILADHKIADEVSNEHLARDIFRLSSMLRPRGRPNGVK
jgi:hypothetical protein